MSIRRSSDEMFPLIKLWEESGLTRAEFCQRHYLQLGTFTYWRKKYLASEQVVASVCSAAKTQNKESRTGKSRTDFVAIEVSQDSSPNHELVLELSVGKTLLHFYQFPSSN